VHERRCRSLGTTVCNGTVSPERPLPPKQLQRRWPLRAHSRLHGRLRLASPPPEARQLSGLHGASGALLPASSSNCADGVGALPRKCTGSSCWPAPTEEGQRTTARAGPIAGGLPPPPRRRARPSVSTCGNERQVLTARGTSQKYTAGWSCAGPGVHGQFRRCLTTGDGFGSVSQYAAGVHVRRLHPDRDGKPPASTTDADCVAATTAQALAGGTFSPQKVPAVLKPAAAARFGGTCGRGVSEAIAPTVCACESILLGSCQVQPPSEGQLARTAACAPPIGPASPNASKRSSRCSLPNQPGVRTSSVTAPFRCRNTAAGTSCASGTCSGNTPQAHRHGLWHMPSPPRLHGGALHSSTVLCLATCAIDRLRGWDSGSRRWGRVLSTQVLTGAREPCPRALSVARWPGTCGECVSGTCSTALFCTRGAAAPSRRARHRKRRRPRTALRSDHAGHAADARNGNVHQAIGRTTCAARRQCDGAEGHCRKYRRASAAGRELLGISYRRVVASARCTVTTVGAKAGLVGSWSTDTSRRARPRRVRR